MEIVEIEAIPLRCEVDGPAIGSSRGTTNKRSTTLVRLETDAGLVGWGEAFAPPRTVATLVDEMFADRVVGRDVFDVRTLADESYTDGYHFGRAAIVRCAVSGIDTACWDLIGQETGQPIHQLLGGGSAQVVTPYASTGYITDPESPIDGMIEDAAEDGFDAIKIKIGCGLDDDVERVRKTREIIGDDALLMVDFNGNYRPKQAVRAAKA